MIILKLNSQIVFEIRTSIALEELTDGSTQLLIPESVVARLAELIDQQIDILDSEQRANLALTTIPAVLSLSETVSDDNGVVRYSGGLTPLQLSRVTDHIEAYLSERPDMVRLAAIAGLSRNHFGYAFRQSTGQTPRDYIFERRMARAKVLLLEGLIPIAQVALAVGFANQSHFTYHFRRLTGLTPARFRRNEGQGSIA